MMTKFPIGYGAKFLRFAWAAAATAFVTIHSTAALLPVDNALPMVGTGGHGHTYPGATVPFGFVQLSPDTRTDGWDACPGYNYADTNILGFSHLHLSGTGGIDLGDVLVMPVVGDITISSNLSTKTYQSGFSHEEELAQPGYYRVTLDRYQVLAELTASAHCGVHRYTFPASAQSHLLVDLVHGLGGHIKGAELNIQTHAHLTGWRNNDGWVPDRMTYFAIEASRPFDDFGLELNGKPLPSGQTEAKGKNVRAHLDFKTTSGEQIVLRAGVSPTSVEDAENNLRAEILNRDFDSVRQTARDQWSENLSRITIETGNPTVRQTFYSALYHTMAAPTLYNNADSSYRGQDKQKHAAPGFQLYSTMSLWDTFRAEHPLLTIVEPERINDLVQSLLLMYKESTKHVLPIWPLANHDTTAMIGNHSIPVIYDAYQKGFRGFDAELAYQAMRDSVFGHQKRQDEYNARGYITWAKGREASVSATLEHSYDDWCIAQMAKALGKTDDYELFSKRSQNYTNLWEPDTQFFRSKDPDGKFHEPFDPIEVAKQPDNASGSYTEANAWQYAFAEQQDIPAMIKLYGGNEAFVRRLDQFFDMDSYMPNWRIDVTGLIGQYAHGNEPCQQFAYLYALAGAPAKTAKRVRQIQLMCYDNSPEGLCGNDDCGQISAWYVWSAIGLYPVNPANGIYVIGAPLVEKAVVHLNPKFYKGSAFTVVVHSNTHYARCEKMDNYIQSAKLNGSPLNRAWITQQEIAEGGTLELEMGILPNDKWATGD